MRHGIPVFQPEKIRRDGIEELKQLLTNELQPAGYFAEATGLSSAKVSALFRKMKENGEVRVDKVKGKSGKVNGYAAPTED